MRAGVATRRHRWIARSCHRRALCNETARRYDCARGAPTKVGLGPQVLESGCLAPSRPRQEIPDSQRATNPLFFEELSHILKCSCPIIAVESAASAAFGRTRIKTWEAGEEWQ